jgi:hypothetical protein
MNERTEERFALKPDRLAGEVADANELSTVHKRINGHLTRMPYFTKHYKARLPPHCLCRHRVDFRVC